MAATQGQIAMNEVAVAWDLGIGATVTRRLLKPATKDRAEEKITEEMHLSMEAAAQLHAALSFILDQADEHAEQDGR